MRTILLIMIGLSTYLLAEITRNNTTNIVTDTKTNIQWQDEEYTTAEKDAYNDNTENGKVLFWVNAIAYCEALELGDKEDWRLPNINELLSITDDSKSTRAIVDGFVNVYSDDYWSSTTVASTSNEAWFVSFSNGYDYGYYKGTSNFVRCVRGGQ